MEGRGSDVGRRSGRRDETLSGDGRRRRLVDTVTGKPGPALWTGTVRLRNGNRAKSRPLGRRGAWTEPSGNGQAPRPTVVGFASNPGTPNRHRVGDRRPDHGNRPRSMGYTRHGLPCGVWNRSRKRRKRSVDKAGACTRCGRRTVVGGALGRRCSRGRWVFGRPAMVSRSPIRLSTAPSRCDSSAFRAGMHETNRGLRATGRDVRTNPGRHGTRAGGSGAGKSGPPPGRWVLALRSTFGKRQEGLAHREVLSATWEGKPLKGKPHRRYRHETGPEGSREEQGVKRSRKPVGAAQPGEASLV